jgi:hypothetical protein
MMRTEEAMDLPLRGRVVSGVAWGIGGLWVRFWGQGVPNSTAGPEYALHIESAFRLVLGDAVIDVDPRTPEAALFKLVRRRVIEATASDDGRLAIAFDDGDGLEIPPGAFEAWQLEGDNGELFVSVAGGGLTAWDPE